MEKQKSNVLAIIVMILLFGMISFVTNLASPMGDVLKHQFGVANWMGTLGVFANFIAYAVMGIPAGNMLSKFGYKKTALIAIGVGFIGVGIQTISGFAESFGVYLLGAFVAGFSMCMLNIVVNPMLNKLGGGGNKGNQLIQIGGSFNSLMGTAVIILTGLLIPNIAAAQISDVNGLMYTALAIFAVAFIVVSGTAIPENAPAAAATAEKSKYGPMSFRHFVLGAIAIFVYVGVEVGIPNVLQKWLNEVSTTAIAGTVAGTYWFLMLCGRLLGGVIGGKVSSKVMISTVSALAIVFILVGMYLPTSLVKFPAISSDLSISLVEIPVGVMFFMLCGLCTSVMWGAIFNLAVEGLGKYTSIASGLFMVMVCGGGVLPVVQGAVADSFGFINSYWVLVIAVAYILWFGLVGSKPKKA